MVNEIFIVVASALTIALAAYMASWVATLAFWLVT